ncbi:MAG: hypothetical protein QOD39_5356 [Mycobacterium sp.]|nr:hypothetical protein [Mycobacterium sp.]
MAAEYGGSVEQVYRAFSDEQYWLVRLADSGADDATLDSMSDDRDGIYVKTTQTLRADRLPAVVTQFHRGDLSFVREETWTPVRDGRATAAVKGSITHAPATLTGTAVLAPAESGAGSRLELTTTVEVNIPLVGGKIENFIGAQLVDLLIAEQRFTTLWITENA